VLAGFFGWLDLLFLLVGRQTGRLRWQPGYDGFVTSLAMMDIYLNWLCS
jgi:hypothetical protein